ncbi:hypothetical protein [Candidatus Electrothrix sp.]|uniref:hypothetical protein n=1 Tax=Candidatus Electrothrix sp. TaxID=2170559 RepID=UPI00405735D6
MQSTEPLRTFYKTLEGEGEKPLTPDHPYYVSILGATPEKDPVRRLWQRIDISSSESVNLLTGFRGNGKSTELRRLKKLLEDDGCTVFLVNMLDYLLMTKPVELSDFILSLMAALSHAVGEDNDLNLQPLTRSYWDRLTSFLQSEIEVDKFGLKAKSGISAVDLGLKLKIEPDFKQHIQQRLRGHLTRLVEDAQEFVDELVRAIRKTTGDPDKKVVLLVDSVEQLRGLGGDAEKVYASVRELFSGQAGHLAFPKLHVVYTVPPFLLALAQNLGRNLGGHPVTQWPNIHVRKKADNGQDADGIGVMAQIISKRYPDWQEIFQPEALGSLAAVSGGDLRDFFRLIRECLVSCMLGSKPEKKVDQEIIERAVQDLKNDMLPLADEDARFLARIHKSKRQELGSIVELPVQGRCWENNLIMNYLNGNSWYDIHPALIEEIKKQGLLNPIEEEIKSNSCPGTVQQ